MSLGLLGITAPLLQQLPDVLEMIAAGKSLPLTI
jgi:hypothetical protein